MAEGIIRKVQRKVREAMEGTKPYSHGENPEKRSTYQQLRERQRRIAYEEEKATGAPVPSTFEEWDRL